MPCHVKAGFRLQSTTATVLMHLASGSCDTRGRCVCAAGQYVPCHACLQGTLHADVPATVLVLFAQMHLSCDLGSPTCTCGCSQGQCVHYPMLTWVAPPPRPRDSPVDAHQDRGHDSDQCCHLQSTSGAKETDLVDWTA
jgi:hypothetical protein